MPKILVFLIFLTLGFQLSSAESEPHKTHVYAGLEGLSESELRGNVWVMMGRAEIPDKQASGELLTVSTYAMVEGSKRPVKVSERSYCGDFVLPRLFAPRRIADRPRFYLARARQNGPTSAKRLDELAIARFKARRLNSALGIWSAPDPLARDFAATNPYVYCAANPIRFIDPTGKVVTLYATTLPGVHYSDPDLNDIISEATHTFLVVSNKTGTHIYSFGSLEDGIKNIIGGKLGMCDYPQDKNIVNGKMQDKLKAKIEIAPPENMTVDEFDSKVMQEAENFNKNSGQTYSVIPMTPSQGNCNSSSATILLRSGVSEENIDKIKKQIPGNSIGFSSVDRTKLSFSQVLSEYSKNSAQLTQSIKKIKPALMNYFTKNLKNLINDINNKLSNVINNIFK